jgi:DNA-directed RNA polymerase specialized sigma24 family protein
MARIDWVEQRLQRWGQAVTERDGSGYPVMSVLHEDWMPPSPGVTPSMKISLGRSDAASTHRAISRLSRKQRDAVVIHYALKLPMAEQAARLGCAVDTVHGRIEAAHAQLAAILDESEPQQTNRNNQ